MRPLPTPVRLVLLALAVSVACRPAERPVTLETARAALGYFPDTGIELLGHADFMGGEASFTWCLAADGRFRREIHGPVTRVTGFDGSTFWQLDEAGVPYEHGLYAREYGRCESAVVAGLWCVPGAGFACTPSGPGALDFGLADGLLRGKLELDPATSLPRTWRVSDVAGDTGLELAGWRPALGVQVARELVIPGPGGGSRFHVDEVRVPRDDDFTRPPRTASGTAFDAGVAPELRLLVASTGHLLVRPRIAGEDVGWFLLDTGASVSAAEPELMERLGMQVVGRRGLAGAGAEVASTRLRAGGPFELGPLSIERVVWNELAPAGPLDELRDVVKGEPLAGILGFDVLVRAVVELDLAAGRVALHDPERYRAPEGVRWEELVLHRKRPHVRCRSARGAGWFCLDCGSGALSVAFHDAADMRGEEVEAVGVGGPVRLVAGTIDWFEAGGRRFESPRVYFAGGEQGALADPWSEGTLGTLFFEGRTLLLDYAGGRMGVLDPR